MAFETAALFLEGREGRGEGLAVFKERTGSIIKNILKFHMKISFEIHMKFHMKFI